MSIETRELSTVDGVGRGPTARSISYAPSPYISATNVQAALDTLGVNYALTQSYAQSASASADTATSAASSAQGYATAAAASAGSAATQASSATASAATATAQASAASASATSANSSKIAAEAAATAAAGYLASTQASATAAANSESAAAGYASAANASATAAAGSASTASTAATNASTSATNAANSASAASTSATNAANSASAASTSATNAANSATSAQGYATAAATSESNASGYASAAAASAALAASYTLGWTGTSATSVLIAIGSKSFTASTGKVWAAGSPLLISSAANANNFMFGVVTSYVSGTGALTVNVTAIGGAGAFSDWNISLSGQKGIDGTGAGDVLGPGTNNDGWIPTWNGTNSKTLANGIDPATLLTTAAAAAGYQPLDSDLTAIAALFTTAYGRALLTLANQAALIAEANGPAETSVIFVSKTGSDANTGLYRGLPKLTIAAAITAAAALITGGVTASVVHVLDSRQYTENITLPNGVSLHAPSATLIGTVVAGVGSNCIVDKHYAASGSTTLFSIATNSGEASLYKANITDGRGTGGALTNVNLFQNDTSGRVLFVEIGGQVWVPQGGIGFRDSAGAGFGHIHLKCPDVYLAGNNAQAIRTNNANTNIIGSIDHILEVGTPTGTVGVDMRDASSVVKLTVSEIIADEVWNISAGNLYLQCPKLTGTRTGTPKVLGGWDPSAADRLLYGSAAGVTSETAFTSYGRTLIALANASALAAQITSLPLTWGTTQTITGDAETFPGGWANNLKLAAARYPALWFHGANDNRGVIYAMDCAADIFWMEKTTGSTTPGVRIYWDLTNKTYHASSGWSLGAASAPWAAGYLTSIELGHASDTTLARASAGNVSIEGNIVYRAGGTDVPVADGGTGASDAATARSNLGAAPTNDPTFTGTITLPAAFGINRIEAGTGDGASFTTYNVKFQSWWGIGFSAYESPVRAVLNTRDGTWNVLGGYQVNGASVYYSGGTDVPVSDGGTGASDAATARSNLGLGSISTFAEGTAAEYRQNTSGKALSTDKVWSAASTHATLTDAATVTPDFNYFDHDWTIGATGRTLANPTNIKVGQRGTIHITQDGGGSKTITTYGSYYKFPGGIKPTLSTAAGARDRITYDVVSSTQIDCFFAGAMS